MERKKKRRGTAGQSQSHNDTDGVSESELKRQEKTLKVMREGGKCRIDSYMNASGHIYESVNELLN